MMSKGSLNELVAHSEVVAVSVEEIGAFAMSLCGLFGGYSKPNSPLPKF